MRDCEHGRLARSCEICELEAENKKLSEELINQAQVNCRHFNRIQELEKALKWYLLNVGALVGTPEIYKEAMTRLHGDLGTTARKILKKEGE